MLSNETRRVALVAFMNAVRGVVEAVHEELGGGDETRMDAQDAVASILDLTAHALAAMPITGGEVAADYKYDAEGAERMAAALGIGPITRELRI